MTLRPFPRALAGIGVVAALIFGTTGVWVVRTHQELAWLKQDIDAQWVRLELHYRLMRVRFIRSFRNQVGSGMRQVPPPARRRDHLDLLDRSQEAMFSFALMLAPDQLTDPGAVGCFVRAQSAIDSALRELANAVQAYPTQAASASYRAAIDDLEAATATADALRRRLNDGIAAYNRAQLAFPAHLVAAYDGFRPRFPVEPEAVLSCRPADE
ncbi:MAG: LemA family protein [Candidatus Rokubacteria bacterium]|nr:LemA family protein [Candidatus Rokubacteria bacterium]